MKRGCIGVVNYKPRIRRLVQVTIRKFENAHTAFSRHRLSAQRSIFGKWATVKASNKARAETFPKIQTGQVLSDMDHKIQNQVQSQWGTLYNEEWALLGAITVVELLLKSLDATKLV